MPALQTPQVAVPDEIKPVPVDPNLSVQELAGPDVAAKQAEGLTDAIP